MTRTSRLLFVAAVIVGGVVACGDDDSGISVNDPRDGAEINVGNALIDIYDGVNVEVGTPPICDFDFDEDAGTVSGTCEGIDELATDLSATVEGTADVDEETCSVDVVASRDGEQVAEESGIDCFEES